ncbi:MAG: hypothetical protein FWC00_00410 [Firmicutes bacterium]|nr:hypothetical protein [Bacillota bacterium]
MKELREVIEELKKKKSANPQAARCETAFIDVVESMTDFGDAMLDSPTDLSLAWIKGMVDALALFGEGLKHVVAQIQANAQEVDADQKLNKVGDLEGGPKIIQFPTTRT